MLFSRLTICSSLVALAMSLGGCGNQEPEMMADAIDVRVPTPKADPTYVDLLTPDITIKPGEEKMYCFYLNHEGEDMAASTLEAYQGKYGHHIVLLTTIEPQPAGTMEDCTGSENMWKFRSFILPGNDLPAGHGILVKKGLQYVMQIHYVNAGKKPIVVRDVARIKKTPIESVKTWVGTLTTNSLNFKVPARSDASETIDCTVPQDSQLLLVGGHMHEWGTRFDLFYGASTDNMAPLYQVDEWKPDFRDAPPVTLLYNNPLKLTKGMLLRTRCQWRNKEDREIHFPEEMCAGFGYLAGIREPIHCENSKK